MYNQAILPPPPIWIELAAAVIPKLPAGRYRAINWLSRYRKKPFLAQMPSKLGGCFFNCDLRDSISQQVCFAGIYEPQETALVQGILKSGMTFVDVGANWGYFTLMAASLVGSGGKVLSLEPDPRMYNKLKENITRNQHQQVTVLPVAAAAEAGYLTLAGYDENNGNFGISRLVSDRSNATNLFQVETAPLDEILGAQQLESVELMKMDIEGAEALALSGLQRSLSAGRIKRLLLELHPFQLAESGSSAEGVMSYLWDFGYRPLSIDHSQATTRAIVYGRITKPEQFLVSLNENAELDDWPHQLWIAPGVEAL